MRDRSEASDFDIFFVPSRSDMTRGAGPSISGSVSGKKPFAEAVRRAIDAGKVVVEFLGDVAGQLQMLLLVVADRHMRGAVDQDVGGHQVRIGEQPDRGVLAVLAGLLLELRHAVEPAHAGDAVEDPGELGVLGDPALVEDDVLLRIDAGGEEGRGDLAGRAVRSCGVLPCVIACRSTTQ